MNVCGRRCATLGMILGVLLAILGMIVGVLLAILGMIVGVLLAILGMIVGVLLAILGMIGIISPVADIGEGTVAAGYQNFLICVEMFFASIAMHFAFPYRRYCSPNDRCGSDGGGVTIGSLQSISSNLKEAVNPRDIVADAVYNFHPQYQQYTRHNASLPKDELEAYYRRSSESPDGVSSEVRYQDQAVVVPAAAANGDVTSGKNPASSSAHGGETAVAAVMPGLGSGKLNEKAVLLPTNDVV